MMGTVAHKLLVAERRLDAAKEYRNKKQRELYAAECALTEAYEKFNEAQTLIAAEQAREGEKGK